MAYRKIHIGKDVWEYVVGKEGVKIINPNKKGCAWVKNHVILGVTAEQHKTDLRQLYDDDYDCYLSYPIVPGDIKKYIEKNLL